MRPTGADNFVIMKNNLIFFAAVLAAAVGVAFLLSILGHFELWIFSNSFNDNLFIAGGLAFVLGLFTQSNTSQYAKGMGVLFTGKNETPENHRGSERGRIGILLSLTAMFVIICLLSFLLPHIRL